MFAYYWIDELSKRETGRLNPESSARNESLSPQNILDIQNRKLWTKIEPRNQSILKTVHAEAYINEVRFAFEKNRRFIDSGDTVVTPQIYPLSLLAASAGVNAIESMKQGQIKRAFCAIRPPGHHANQLRALGFCVFNNAAVAARFAQTHLGLERILIIDWDVHPGNGTEEVFWEDPSVFTLSIHEEGIFSQAGGENRIGKGAGEGFCRNVNVCPKTSNESYMDIFKNAVDEVVESFRPELIIISAGFDAHRRDRVSRLKLEDETFALMTKYVLDASTLSAKGRVLSFLEGGYDLLALKSSVKAHVDELIKFKDTI